MVSIEHSNAEDSSKNAKELGDRFLFTAVVLTVVLSGVALIFVITRSITHDMYGISFAEAFAAAFVILFGVVIAAILVISLFGAAVIAYRRKRKGGAEAETGRTG